MSGLLGRKVALSKTGAMLAAFVQRIRDLETSLEEQINYHKEREMKAEARDKQHLKLVDYLQSKVKCVNSSGKTRTDLTKCCRQIEELSHKKKSLTEVIFGSSKSKENQPPISLALNYRDLEAQLAKEKEASRKLKEQVVKLKSATVGEVRTCLCGTLRPDWLALQANPNGRAGLRMEKSKSQILTPGSKAVLDQIAISPTQKREMGQGSGRRMHHNIPHRCVSFTLIPHN